MGRQLLKAQTFHSFFIWSDCCTFDSYIVLQDSHCRIDGHLVVSLVSVRKAKVVVLAVHVNVRENQLKRHIIR